MTKTQKIETVEDARTLVDANVEKTATVTYLPGWLEDGHAFAVATSDGSLSVATIGPRGGLHWHGFTPAQRELLRSLL